MTFGDLFDFSDWDDQGIVKNIISNTGITGWTIDSNPAQFEDDSSPLTATENLEINNFQGLKYYATEYDIYWQFKLVSPDRDLTGHLKFYVRETDGAYYRIQFNEIDDPSAQFYRFDHEYFDGTTTYDKDGTEFNSIDLNNNWLWIRVQVTISGNDRVFSLSYDFNNKTDWRDVGTWTTNASPANITATNQKNISFIAPIEVQLVGDTNSQQTYQTNQFELTSDDAPFVGGPTSIGSLDIQSIYARTQMGAEGKAELVISDLDLANKTTIENNLRTALQIKSEVWDHVYFHGEITKLDMFRNTAIYGVQPIAHKLRKTRAKYASNLQYSGELMYYDDLVIHHSTIAPYVNDNSWDDLLVLFEKKKFYQFTMFPNDVAEETSFASSATYTPDATDGAVENLFHRAQEYDLGDHSNYYASEDQESVGSTDYITVLTFDVYLRTGTSIRRANIDFAFRCRRLGIIGITDGYAAVDANRPQIAMYDYTAAAWVQPTYLKVSPNNGYAKGYDGIMGITGFDGSRMGPVHEVSMNLSNFDPDGSESLSDFYDNTSESAIGNFTRHRFRLAISHGGPGSNPIIIYYAGMTLTVDTLQSSDYGKAQISSTTLNSITLKAAGSTAFLDANDVPAEDGIFPEDYMYVVDNIESLFSSLWVSGESGLADNLTLDWETNLGNSNGLLRDIQNEYVYNLLQESLSILNGAWYWRDVSGNSPSDTIYIKSSFSSCGLTLTEDDIIARSWTEIIDTERQRDNLLVVGKDGVVSDVQSNTEEFTHNLGAETEIINAPSVRTKLEADDYASNVASLYTSASRIFKCKINFSKPKQDYSVLLVGDTVGVKITVDGTVLINYTSGNDGELLIYAIDLNRNNENGYQDIVTLTLQKRL